MNSLFADFSFADISFVGLYVGFLTLLLTIPLWLAAVRMIRGPGFADRFVALDMLTGVAVALAALASVATGRGNFLDIGLGIALVNFVATAALSAFLEQKGKDE